MARLLGILLAVSLVSLDLAAQGRLPRAPRPWVDTTAATVLALAEPFQTTVVANPSTIEFTASPDHDAVDVGVPVVTSYDVVILPAAGGAAVKTASIGKPTPVSGKITLTTFQTIWTGLPAGSYKAQAVAKGAGGAAAGPISVDPFSVTSRAPAAPGPPIFRQ